MYREGTVLAGGRVLTWPLDPAVENSVPAEEEEVGVESFPSNVFPCPEPCDGVLFEIVVDSGLPAEDLPPVGGTLPLAVAVEPCLRPRLKFLEVTSFPVFLYLTPQALHKVFGPAGPLLHNGVSVAPH